MKTLPKDIKRISLYNVVCDWIKEEKFITNSKIMNSFSVPYEYSARIINELIKDDLIEKETTYDKGHRVKVKKDDEAL